MPQCFASSLDSLALLELSQQECCQYLRRRVTRTGFKPRVLVDLATKELAPIGPLFPKDLGALYLSRIVDDPAHLPPRM